MVQFILSMIYWITAQMFNRFIMWCNRTTAQSLKSIYAYSLDTEKVNSSLDSNVPLFGVGGHHRSLQNQFPPFPLLSTALWDLANHRPVQSQMLSSHLFLCLPCLPPLSLCLARWFWLNLMNGRHDHTISCSLRLFTLIRRSLCGPIACWHRLPRW